MMASSMNTLAPEDRENVILIDGNGKAHANKAWLLAQGSTAVHIRDNQYQDSLGHRFSMPQPTEKPCASSDTSDNTTLSTFSKPVTGKPNVYNPGPYPGSGPYRRVWSTVPTTDVAAGHSYEDATVYLPSSHTPARHPGIFERVTAATVSQAGTHDTGCVYMGGWSAGYVDATGNYQAFAPVDAGFTHDNGSNAYNPTYTVQPVRDSWVMTIFYNPGGGSRNFQQAVGVNFAFRLLADQTVPFKFYISRDPNSGSTYLNLIATAHAQSYAINPTTNQYDDLGVKAWTIQVTTTQPNNPWHVDGTGVVLKRMTSVAQDNVLANPNHAATCSYIRNVQWTHCRIGVSGQAPNTYLTDWNYAHTGGTENYPAGNRNVRVTNLNPDPAAPNHLDYRQETDNVSLCGH